MKRLPISLLLALPALAGPAVAAPDDAAAQQASLIPLHDLAHPRKPGQLPAGGASPSPGASTVPLDPEAITVEQPQDVVRPRFGFGAYWPIPAPGQAATQPAPTFDVTLWQGGWGVSAGATMLGTLYLPGRAAPYIKAYTPLTELLLRQRTVEDPYDRANPDAPVKAHTELWVGYRGLGLADVNFAAAGGAFTLPIHLRDFTLKGSGLGAVAPSGAFCLDGKLAFGLRSGALEAEVGVRDLLIAVAGQPVLNTWGPQASIGATF